MRGDSTIGQMIDVDHVFGSTFDYQTRAVRQLAPAR
jgi:hypothetical protein